MSVLMRWYCGGVMLSCPHQRCLGHGVTPLIRQQAEAAAWCDGASWADVDQQRYLNDAGRFVMSGYRQLRGDAK